MTSKEFFTKYLQIGERLVCQIEIHYVDDKKTGVKQDRRWLKRQHLKEIEALIYEPVKARIDEKDKDENKLQHILTGKSIRLGYVFKKKAEHHTLLLPYNSETSDDEDFYSNAYSVYREKLVVFMSSLESSSPKSVAELVRILNDCSQSQPSSVSISNYFTKQSSSCHGESSCNRINQSGGNTENDIKPEAPPSEGKRTAIKNLVGRTNKAISKVKKGKRIAKILKNMQNMESNNQLETKPVEHESCGTSLETNPVEHESCGISLSVKSDTKDFTSVKDEKYGSTTLSSCKEWCLNGIVYKFQDKTFCTSSSTEPSQSGINLPHNKIQNKTYNSDSASSSAESSQSGYNKIQDNKCNLSTTSYSLGSDQSGVDEVKTETKYNTNNLPCNKTNQTGLQNRSDNMSHSSNMSQTENNLNRSQLKHEAEWSPNVEEDGRLSVCVLSDTDDINCGESMPSGDPAAHELSDCSWNEMSVDMLTKSDTRGEAITRKEDHILSVKSKNLDDDESGNTHKRMDVDNFKKLDTDLIRKDKSDNETLSDNDSDSDDSDLPDCSFVAFKSNKRSSLFQRALDICESLKTKKKTHLKTLIEGGSVRNQKGKRKRTKYILPSLSPSHSDEEMIPLKCQKYEVDIFNVDGNMNEVSSDEEMERFMLSVENGDDNVENSDDNVESEILNIGSVSCLNEEQLKYLVLKNKKYLKTIFQGDGESQRHLDYKNGGRKRKLLNHQVHVGLFTESQQDVVMETLMSIFCSKHHKYLEYVMKVLLPEMLIKIHMDVHNITHTESESMMKEALSKPGAVFQ